MMFLSRHFKAGFSGAIVEIAYLNRWAMQVKYRSLARPYSSETPFGDSRFVIGELNLFRGGKQFRLEFSSWSNPIDIQYPESNPNIPRYPRLVCSNFSRTDPGDLCGKR